MINEKSKIAVVLFNLGGPLNLNDVEPFLFNLFNDKAIIKLPQPLRYLLARYISKKRHLKAQDIYKKMGGGSTILAETQEQAQALEEALNSEIQSTDKNNQIFKVFIAMRYWDPLTEDTLKEVKSFSPNKVILLPLYPQFSTTTTNSSIDAWFKAAHKNNFDVQTKVICCYHNDPLFIEAYSEILLYNYDKACEFLAETGKNKEDIIVLFSAHSLPKHLIKLGDPYQWQITQTTNAVIEKSNIKNITYKICYQSKVGRLPWLTPSTEEEIIEAAKQNKVLIIVPISFVSEHSETLVELDIDYKDLAYSNGASLYLRAATVRANAAYIKCLSNLCNESISDNNQGNISAIDKVLLTNNRYKECKQYSKCLCNNSDYTIISKD